MNLDDFENARDALAELQAKAIQIQEHLNQDNLNNRAKDKEWRKRARYALYKTHKQIIEIKSEIKKYRDEELENIRLKKEAKALKNAKYQKSRDRIFTQLLRDEIVEMVGLDKAKAIFSDLGCRADQEALE